MRTSLLKKLTIGRDEHGDNEEGWGAVLPVILGKRTRGAVEEVHEDHSKADVNEGARYNTRYNTRSKTRPVRIRHNSISEEDAAAMRAAALGLRIPKR